MTGDGDIRSESDSGFHSLIPSIESLKLWGLGKDRSCQKYNSGGHQIPTHQGPTYICNFKVSKVSYVGLIKAIIIIDVVS